MKLSTIAQKNEGISLAGERIVVVGGTQGIGAGIACRFAEAGAEVWIVGRNEEKAKGVLEAMNASSAGKKLDPAPEHAFLKADLSLVAEARKLSGEVRNRAGEQGIDYLVMTQGGPPNGTFLPTKEGYEQHYAVQVLSRFTIAHELASDPESSTVKQAVMSIMAPGQNWGKTFDADDIDLQKANKKGTYGMFTAASRDSIVVDSFTQDLAKKNSKVNFTHVYPGGVKTDFARNSEAPWWLSFISSVGFKLGVGFSAPQQYAAVPFYLLAHPEGRKLAAREMYTNPSLAAVTPHANFKDETIRGKIRSHLLGVLGSK